VTCICCPLFWRVAIKVWPQQITCQPISPKAYEAKLSPLYKHTKKRNYIQFPSCSAVFETSFWTADCWTLTDILFGIIQQRQNCLQASEFWTGGQIISVYFKGRQIFVLFGVFFIPMKVSGKKWRELEIFLHGRERKSVLYKPACEFQFRQIWRQKKCRQLPIIKWAEKHFRS
jgi:hypothetical protein